MIALIRDIGRSGDTELISAAIGETRISATVRARW